MHQVRSVPNNFLQKQQGDQGGKAFAFCVVTANDKHAEPSFKSKRRA